MKKIIGLFIILVLVGCGNSTKSSPGKKAIAVDTVSLGTGITIELDSIIKTSKPFEFNNRWWYWENYGYTTDEIKINLKDFKTRKTILSEFLYKGDIDADFNSDDYFDKLNENFFDDLNFDGFKDFHFYYKGSMAMTSSTSIFLYNNDTKAFDSSEYLSANSIEEMNAKERKLITYSFERQYDITKTHYFDKAGKVRYSEVLTSYWDPVEYKIFEKIVDGTVVKRTVDSTATRE